MVRDDVEVSTPCYPQIPPPSVNSRSQRCWACGFVLIETRSLVSRRLRSLKCFLLPASSVMVASEWEKKNKKTTTLWVSRGKCCSIQPKWSYFRNETKGSCGCPLLLLMLTFASWSILFSSGLVFLLHWRTAFLKPQVSRSLIMRNRSQWG